MLKLITILLKPAEVKQRKVLIASLNWGMGHLSRSLAVIHRLRKQNNEIYFAGDSKQIEIVQMYFADLKCIYLEPYPFKFGTKGRFGFDLLLQSRKLVKRFKGELKDCESIVKEFGIDLVISDHRYGFRSESVFNIFITHQINLPVKWWQLGVQLMHRRLMNRFNCCWIPDTEDSEFSGNLSKSKDNKKLVYIGVLSRFEIYGNAQVKDIDVIVIVSGPENLALDYLNTQIDFLKKDGLKIKIISPIALTNQDKFKNLDFCLNWLEADLYILKSKKIISRSGYSTIMDISYLKCDSDLLPTPGQREQEYLYKLWQKRNEKLL